MEIEVILKPLTLEVFNNQGTMGVSYKLLVCTYWIVTLVVLTNLLQLNIPWEVIQFSEHN